MDSTSDCPRHRAGMNAFAAGGTGRWWSVSASRDHASISNGALRNWNPATSRYRIRLIAAALAVALGWYSFRAGAGLLPFPLSAGQRGTVRCLETKFPNYVYYDAYLPPAYSTNGPALPIIYTFNPGGGGMVSDFLYACARQNIICVGIIGSENYGSTDIWMRECAAVSRDIRHRVRFDPTAEFASGFSGGGLASYMFSRFRAQHVAGVFSMSCWLGRGTGYPDYQTTDRVVRNLLVARSMGLSDGGSWVMAPDANYLTQWGAVIHDEYFTGGHQVCPDTVKTNCLAWLISQRIPPGPDDQANAEAQTDQWRARIAAGEREAVLRECVATLMNQPRSWMALEAELVLDDLMLDFDSFRALEVNNLAAGDFASDLFYFLARGAGDGADWPRYRGALKALTGITDTSGDRAGDIYNLLVQCSYPSPILRWSADISLNGLKAESSKDTPGLAWALEGCTNGITNHWQQLDLPIVDANNVWSVQIDWPSDATSGFFRVRTSPIYASSPPWPGAW